MMSTPNLGPQIVDAKSFRTVEEARFDDIIAQLRQVVKAGLFVLAGLTCTL
jgi:ribose 5-phosphate isomerase